MRGSRTKARTRAVEVLFEADQRGEDILNVLERRRQNSEQLFGAYTEQLVRGVVARRDEIDEAIQTWARGWSLERMPAVDRNILRLGTWELLFNDDVPDTVAVDEAVGLAKELSTDESPSFVNGVLGRLQSVKPTLVEAPAPGSGAELEVSTEAEPRVEAGVDAEPEVDQHVTDSSDSVTASARDTEPS